jgi:hypothetical protein
MPKQKPVVVESEDDEIDQVESVVSAEPVKKTKKERTPAQKEAFSRALAILKEKREAVKQVEKEKYEKASTEERDRLVKEKYEKAKNHKKKLPPAPSYVTTGDLEKFKLDILNAIPRPEPVKIQPVKAEPIPEPVVAKPIVKKEPIIQKQLTGHELIDKLFFS